MEFWSVLTNVDNLTNLLPHTSPNDGIGKNSEASKHFIGPFQLWKKTFHQRSEIIFDSWTEAERHESPLEWLRRSRRRQGEGMKFLSAWKSVSMDLQWGSVHHPGLQRTLRWKWKHEPQFTVVHIGNLYSYPPLVQWPKQILDGSTESINDDTTETEGEFCGWYILKSRGRTSAQLRAVNRHFLHSSLHSSHRNRTFKFRPKQAR